MDYGGYSRRALYFVTYSLEMVISRDVKERVPFRIFVPAFRSDPNLSVPPFRSFRSDL